MSEKMMDDIFLQAMKQEEGSKQSDFSNKFAVKVGKVVAVDSTDIFLDMGGKAECVVPRSEFTKVPVVGDSVEVVLKVQIIAERKLYSFSAIHRKNGTNN